MAQGIKKTKLSLQKQDKHKESRSINKRSLCLFLLLAPLLCGGFFEWTSCLYSLFLVGYLCYVGRQAGRIVVHKNATLYAVVVFVAFYGISAFWAVDHGMALLGFCKFLPILLFVIVMMQFTSEERSVYLAIVPFLGAAMSVVSVLLGFIPMFHDVFWVNERLTGIFQYTNAFAAFLLSGVVILIGEKNLLEIKHLLCLLALLMGIVLSGSRTVFVLLAAVLFLYVLMMKGKIRWILCVLMAVIVVATVGYTLLNGKLEAIGRYLTISVSDSTFLGRMLYFKDALPVILRHPFGLGYKGYFYTQGSFQTGVYTLLNVHNELLQMLLDIGWIPSVMMIVAVVKSFIKKGVSLTKRMLIGAMTAHALFDFDFQFVSLAFILILAMDLDSGDVLEIQSRNVIRGVGGVAAAISVWLGISSGLYQLDRWDAALKVYPGYTDARISKLSKLEDADEMEPIADGILEWNKSISLAYSAKARAAYAKGDFVSMITYKQKAISLSRYTLDEYLDYFNMLYVGAQLYQSNGDSNSAMYCIQKLLEIPSMLEQVLDGTDGIAWKIKDKPDLKLPDEYQDVIDLLQGAPQ